MDDHVRSTEYEVRSTEHGTPGFRTPHPVLRTPYSVLLEIALIFAVFSIQGAWPVPDVNEPHYVGKAIHYWNPDWLRGDFFMESADTHTVFYFTFGWLSLWLGPVALCWSGRLLTWLLLAWAWRRLSWAVVPRPWCAVLTAALFACLMDRCHMAGEWVIGGVEAKGFAYVLVFLGLESLVRNRWNRALLLFGAAAAFHVLVGGWAAVAAGVAWLWLTKLRPGGAATACGFARRAPPLRSLWPGLLGGLLLSLPGLAPSLMLDRGVAAETTRQAHQIYVFERLPHHLVLTGIRPDFIARLGLLWVFWLLLGRLSRSLCHCEKPPHCNGGAFGGGADPQEFARESWDGQEQLARVRRLRAFVTGAVLISLVGAALHVLIPFDRALAADLLRYYWFRLSDVALPLGVALESVALMAGLSAGGAGIPACPETDKTVCPTKPCRSWLALAILVAAFHVGDRAIDRLAPPPPRSHRLADFQSWRDACQWVADSGKIPPGARFLTPRLAQTFKWYTGHSDVATWKDVPQNAAAILQWWQRIQDIYASGSEKGTGPICAQHPKGGHRPKVGRGKLDLSPFPPESRWYEPLAQRSAESLKQLGAKYGADFLITERTEPPLALEAVYDNPTYVIYRLR